MTSHAESHTQHHVVPLTIYYAIFATLLVLTGVTVAVAYIDLGPFNTVVAIAIACFKALMVVLYFMHVKYASRMTKLVVVSGLFFLGIMLTLTMADYSSREWVNPPAILR